MSKLAIVFPGQGSQYIGMGKALIDNFKVAAEVYEEANDSLGFDLKKIIFDGSMAELTRSENAQPAVVTASNALFRVYMQEFGVLPDYTAGHSLGELSAIIAAGGIKFNEGVCFARKRGILMQQAYSEKRGRVALIVGVNEAQVKEELERINKNYGFVAITGYNSPSQILVAGKEIPLKELGRSIENINGEFIPFSMLPMKVDAPYHSSLMSFLAEDLSLELKNISYSPLKFPVLSNVSALPYESHEDIERDLSLQLVNPVKWRQIISYIEEQGTQIVIDIGPHYALKTIVTECSEVLKTYAFEIKTDFAEIKKYFM